MTIIDKENAILAGQVAQGQILSQIATAVANLATVSNNPVDAAALQAAIAKVDEHVGKVEALIGEEPAPTPTEAPTAFP